MSGGFSGSLGSMLIEAGLIDAEQLIHAREEGEAMGEELAESLIRLSYISENDLYGFLARQVGMEFVQEVESHLDEEALNCIKKV